MKMQKLEYQGFKFGEFFRGLVLERGFTQVDISKVTGIGATALSRYANDVSIPTKRTFRQIVELLAKDLPTAQQKAFIDEKTSIYESIRKSYEESKRVK